MNEKKHLGSATGNGNTEKSDISPDLRQFWDKKDKSGKVTTEALRTAGIVIDPLELFRLMESED